MRPQARIVALLALFLSAFVWTSAGTSAEATHAYDAPAHTYGSGEPATQESSAAASRRGPAMGPTRAPSATPDSLLTFGVAAKTGSSAQEIVETTARAQAARGADVLSGALSPAERAAMARSPWLQKPMLGQAVHRNTADALEEAYPGRFVYRTRGPDFLDTSTGKLLELTIPGQVGAHLARPGYGGVTMCTYTLGAC